MSLALSVILILLGLGLIWLVYTLFWGTPPSLNLAVERLGLHLLLNDPELLTGLGLIDNTLLDFHSGSLTDASPRYMKQLRRQEREGFALIQRYDESKLKGEDKLTYELMRWYLNKTCAAIDLNITGRQTRCSWGLIRSIMFSVSR